MSKNCLRLQAVPLLIAVFFLSGCGGSTSSTTQSHPTPATVIATVPLGISPIAVDVNPVTNRIYVANQGDQPGTVSVIDGATNAVVASVPVGMAPMALAVNSQTNKVYVANSGDGSVTVIDGATNQTTTVSADSQPCYVAVNTVTNKIYVGNAGSSYVTVIDEATNSTTNVVSGSISPSRPCSIAVNSVTNKIYVANTSSVGFGATVIDGATNQTTALPANLQLQQIAVNSASNMAYATGLWYHEPARIFIIDGATLATNIISVADPNNPSDGLQGPLAVNPTTNKIYVPHFSGQVSVIDGATLNVGSVTAGQSPGFVTVDAAINQIYVLNGYSTVPGTTVTVIDGATDTITGLAVGVSPSSAAINSATHRVYVTNSCGNDMSCPNGAPAQGTVSVIEAAH
jgi:YVTN family beta-propeller protein